MENQGTFHSFVETSKDVSVLAREVFVVVVLVLVLFVPGALKDRLQKAGIQQIGDISIAPADETVPKLDRGMMDITANLQEIEGSTKDPATKQALLGITNSLTDLQQQARSSDEQVKTKLADQLATLRPSSSQGVQSSGWIFLGLVDLSHTKWLGDGPRNVASTVSPTVTAGNQLVLTGPAYIYGSKPSAQQREGKIVGVFPKDTQVSVTDAAYVRAHAKADFLWVNVNRTQ